MAGAPSSTSSSERPGWGLAGAVGLLILLKALLPSRDLGLVQGEDAAKPYEIALKDARPDLLAAGDSRVGSLRYDALAKGFGGSPSGEVWTVGGGSVPDMIRLLEERNVRPRVLVLGASPLSMGLRHFTLAYRSGTDPDLDRAFRWKRWARLHAMRPLSFLPDDMGPAVLARNLERFLPEAESAKEKSRIWSGKAPPNLPGFQRYLSEEPAPSAKTVQQTIEAIRRMKAAGTRVVLARLPVTRAMLDLENRWGAEGMLKDVSEGAGVPLIDFNRLETWPSYRDAVEDDSHVTGEEICGRMSEEVGRRARELLH